MNKNRIKGRRVAVSWHHTAKPFGSHTKVNAAVVQGSIECLLFGFALIASEISFIIGGFFQVVLWRQKTWVNHSFLPNYFEVILKFYISKSKLS